MSKYNKGLTKKELEVLKGMEELRKERNTIQNKFKDALKDAETEVETLTKKVEELEETSKDIYTMFVIGEVEASAYQDIQKELNDTKELLTLAESKVDNIHLIETQELKEKLFPKAKELLPQFGKVKRQQEKLNRMEIMKARKEYLQVINKHMQQDNRIEGLNRWYEDLRLQVGDRHNEYVNFSPAINKYVSNAYYGTKGANISRQELGANN